MSQSSVDNPEFLNIVREIESHAIFTLNANGIITSANKGAETISGWPIDTVKGKSFDQLYAEQDRQQKIPTEHLSYAIQESGFQGEVSLATKAGETYLADFSITPIYTDSKLDGYVVIAKDTTQRKKDEIQQLDANAVQKLEIDRRKAIEKALKESNEELDAFASAAAHDLQEPLRMVVSYLQLIERRYAKSFDQDGLDFLAFAIDGATRMKMLIHDLVEYSRIETLGKPLKKTDSNRVLKNVLDSLEVSLTETGTQLTHDALPVVWSDEVQLNEVFQNLIANAIKFGTKDSSKQLKVHVGYSTRPSEVVFSVSDNGPGIDKKDFKTIFLIFKQLGSKMQIEGNGVGLAICKKIVKRHHGRMWVESELGKGSTFYFSIPHQPKEKHD